MPAAANIVINDGATTPVAHTFTPIGRDDKGTLWFEQTTPSPATPLEAKRIGLRQSRNAGGVTNGQSKLIITLALPKLETLGNSSAGITPPPTLAYRVSLRMEIDMPERSTSQERKDTRVLFQNFLGNALVLASIDTLQPVY